jgi:hypothetical protein
MFHEFNISNNRLELISRKIEKLNFIKTLMVCFIN